jgi:hypothetical protein
MRNNVQVITEYIQNSLKVSRRINTKKVYLNPVTVKLLDSNGKEKILKATRKINYLKRRNNNRKWNKME